MSASRPSAFDFLMSNRMSNASNNKKRKSRVDSPIPSSSHRSLLLVSSPNEDAAEKHQENVCSDHVGCAYVETSSSTKKLKKSSNDADLISPDETMLELKKRAVDFEVKRVVYWGKGERVPFMFMAKAFEAISKELSTNAIKEIVCNMLRTVMETTPDDLLAVVYLLANRIAPAHEGLELGIGDASIIKALAEACGTKNSHVMNLYKELGDLGLVAKAIRSSQQLMCKPKALTVAKVFESFQFIAKESGKDSQEKKKNHIKALLVAATDCEPLYLARLLQAKLRIGLAEKTLLAALGHAAVYFENCSTRPAEIDSFLEKAAKIVKQVYSVLPVYDKIVSALLSGGVSDLPKSCGFQLGIPVGPMLAKPAKGISEIVDKFQDMEFTCEYKYDGDRAQVHYMENGFLEIYSRKGERTTGKFPDVAAAVMRLKKPSVTSFVLDCELVAYNHEKQKILPHQMLRTRARKNVVMNEIKVHVCIFAFDILYLNGQPLMHEQLNVRREHLYKSFQEEPGFFQFATAVTSNDVEEIQTFFDDAVNSSCEGLIIKTLNKDATYEPSKKSQNWVKLKKDYMEGIGDSLDLIPIAAFHGKGKRTGAYGSFLLACYDSDREEFQSICKVGAYASPCSDVIPRPKSYYKFADAISPDVWFEPSEVWEVKAADLTISPVSCAAIGVVHPDKGISLRFPRVIRVRGDKNPEQATSSKMVADMYNAQKHNRKDNRDDENEED